MGGGGGGAGSKVTQEIASHCLRPSKEGGEGGLK